MKQIRQITKCEFCDQNIDVSTPPSENEYKAGRISIFTGNILLNNLGDARSVHVAVINQAYFCKPSCLLSYIAKQRTEAEAWRVAPIAPKVTFGDPLTVGEAISGKIVGHSPQAYATAIKDVAHDAWNPDDQRTAVRDVVRGLDGIERDPSFDYNRGTGELVISSGGYNIALKKEDVARLFTFLNKINED